MKVNYLDYDGTSHIMLWILIHSAASQSEEILTEDFDSSSIDLSLKMNGVDIDIVKIMDELSSWIEESRESVKLDGFKKGQEFQLEKMSEWISQNKKI